MSRSGEQGRSLLAAGTGPRATGYGERAARHQARGHTRVPTTYEGLGNPPAGDAYQSLEAAASPARQAGSGLTAVWRELAAISPSGDDGAAAVPRDRVMAWSPGRARVHDQRVIAE